LVLPALLRRTLGLKTGESILLTVEKNGDMYLSTRRQRLVAAQGMFASISPERVLSAELIQERRREVKLESAAEALRVKKVSELSKFLGSGLWDGDLSEMRDDQPRKRKRAKK
jgi:bifunctional DNA-binding transcriptional regulator/antitoxin component of YhaV-PrlF toxin-antitoxin module